MVVRMADLKSAAAFQVEGWTDAEIGESRRRGRKNLFRRYADEQIPQQVREIPLDKNQVKNYIIHKLNVCGPFPTGWTSFQRLERGFFLAGCGKTGCKNNKKTY
jgi:hypothetical protein